MSQIQPNDVACAHAYRGIPLEQHLPIRSTILTALIDQARSYGTDPFITTVSSQGHTTTLSYGELDLLSRRFASWLLYELGICAGDRVALLPANDVRSVVAIFGFLRAGCPILLLNPADPLKRLRQQTESMHIKASFCSPTIADNPAPDAIVVPDVSSWDQELMSSPEPAIEPLADALFFGTSGSTAASKLVAQSHYNAAVNAHAVQQHHQLGRKDRLLSCLPLYHVNSLHFTIFATLVSGAHAILVDAFDPFSYPQFIERFRPRIASVVPNILEVLLETWRQPGLPGNFRYFVSAAAPVMTRTVREVAQKMHVRIIQGYGLTETTNFSTTLPLDLSAEEYQYLMLDTEIPSIGIALYGNEVAVLTEGGRHVAPGEIGEICMRGHNVMMRYAGNPAETASAFRDGWFHSGDLGYAIEKNESGRVFFVITGRRKNIAKVRGETVSLDEMDRFLMALPHIQDAACVSLPHRFLGDLLIAAVVYAEGVQHADLLSNLQTAFSPNALPRQIVRLDAIPRTVTGKIRRAELAEKLTLYTERSIIKGDV